MHAYNSSSLLGERPTKVQVWLYPVNEVMGNAPDTLTQPSNRIPLEKTNRSPRVYSCLGRWLSRARIEASMGNPLNAVFAASTRIAAVAVWNR